MLAVNYSTMRNNLKDYCDKGEKIVVLMSLEQYNQLVKAAKNAEYLAMIDRSIAQFEAGKAQEHELIEVE